MNLLGLDMDSRPSEISDGFYVFGKNGLISYINNTINNEKGFRKLNVTIPYKIIGIIETGKIAVVFSTNNIISEIGTLNLDTEVYTTVINDSNLSYKLNFNDNYPIKGEFQKNYNNEIIVAFKDGNQEPKLINISNNKATTLNDILLFPSWKKCKISQTVTKGGNVIKGSYVPVIRYIKDGLFTDYFVYGKPCYVGDDNDSQIIVQINNIDTNFDKVQLAFLQTNNGVSKVIELESVINSENNTIIYNGSFKREIDFESFFLVTPYYTNAKAITQLNDEIFLGNLQEYNQNKVDYYMQKSALNCKLKWKSTLIGDLYSNFQNNLDYLSGKTKGFVHQETYCFYIVGNLKNGRKTKAYIISNSEFTSDSKDNTNILNNGVNAKKFQVEDTIINSSINIADRTGKFGYWENENEIYPTVNIEGFGNPFVGYSGSKVTHFRTPSQSFCYEKFYSNPELNYGINNLDVLGVICEFQIPLEIQNEVLSFELCYAKRNQLNITNLGQSLMLLGSNKINENNFIDMTSTGGNFNYDGYGTDQDGDKNNYLKEKCLRIHPFDMLFNKLAIEPNLIINHIKLKKTIRTGLGIVNSTNVTEPQSSIDGILNEFGDFDTVFFKDRNILMTLDYTNKNKVIASQVNSTSKYRKLKNFKFNPNNSYSGDIDNRLLEGCYTAELEGVDYNNQNNNLVRIEDLEQTIIGDYSAIKFPKYEVTYLSSLLRIVNNLYLNFYNQEIISTQETLSNGISSVIYGGDCFISDYSFVTYGKRDIFDKSNIGGNRFIHRFLCETVSNINLRYQISGDIYSNFYPKSYGSWIKLLDKNLEPNSFGYDKEFNKLSEQIILPFNPNVEYKYKYPNRIIKSSQLNNNEKTDRSWRNFAPLDFVDIPKNYDEIINIQSYNDNLLIHTSNMLFITRDKGRLDVENLNVVLGSGNIFEFDPIQVSYNNLGLAGTKQDIGLIVSPLGYHFIDNGTPYVFNGKLNNFNNKLTNFFNKYLRETSNNPLKNKGVIFGYDLINSRVLMTIKSDKSYTLSFSLKNNNWSFFHDYIPDFYFHSRSKLYSIYNNNIYLNDEGEYGKYYSQDKKPFIIDMLFKAEGQKTLNSVNWITNTISDYLTNNEKVHQETFSKLSVRNDLQHTGNMNLFSNGVFDSNYVLTNDVYSYSILNNILQKGELVNINDCFNNNELMNNISNIEWYDKEDIYGYYFIVRFEYSNNTNKMLVFKKCFIS